METLELILALPVLVIVTLAIIQFGILMVVHQAVTAAATVAAREAGKEQSINVAVDAAQAVLDIHNITISNTPGSGTMVVLEDGLNPPVTYGDPGMTCTTPVTPGFTNDDIRVTICIDLAVAPIPNSLTSFGLTLAGRHFTVSSVVRRE